jgi:hypothetical protein
MATCTYTGDSLYLTYPSTTTNIDWVSTKYYTPEKYLENNGNLENNICYKFDSSIFNDKTRTVTSNKCYYTWGSSSVVWAPIPIVPSERMRQIIQSRRAPAIIGTRKPLSLTAQERELRARETLRRIVGDMKYRKFLAQGFVTIRAPSGLVYQIFPGHQQTVVWNRGQPVERLCVVMVGDFPPTDSLVARYLMILSSEDQFRKLANVFKTYPSSLQHKQVDMRSLVDIFKELKAAA